VDSNIRESKLQLFVRRGSRWIFELLLGGFNETIKVFSRRKRLSFIYSKLFAFLVIVTCFGEFNSCENASVQKNNLTRLGDYGKNFVVAIFYGFVNFTGSYITVEVPSGSSTVFLIGISNSISVG